MISFTVDAVPVAQPRQRHSIVGGFVRNYTPEKSPVNVFKSMVQVRFAEAYQGPPLEGPLLVELQFVMPRPKYLIWKTKPMERLPCAARPDIDNLVKSVFDSLKSKAWIDDAQVSKLIAAKCYRSGSEQPHVAVWIAILPS